MCFVQSNSFCVSNIILTKRLKENNKISHDIILLFNNFNIGVLSPTVIQFSWLGPVVSVFRSLEVTNNCAKSSISQNSKEVVSLDLIKANFEGNTCYQGYFPSGEGVVKNRTSSLFPDSAEVLFQAEGRRISKRLFVWVEETLICLT